MPTADTSKSHTASTSPGLLAASWALAALYAAIALAAMWLAPRVPYADGWRFLGQFALEPSLLAIFRPDNGHHEVLPHAVRVLELRVFDAQQWLQVGVGIGLLLATLAGMWFVLRKEASPERRVPAMLLAVCGFCWLGNIRTLGHANETVHAYLVTACVVLGITALGSRNGARPDARAAAIPALLGVVAAFSFSSGLAAFVAFLVVALLLRARASAYLVLGLTFVGTLVLRRWDNTGVEAAALGFAPLSQLDLLMRWLAGPSVYAIWPITDPALAAHVPTAALRAVTEWMANAWRGAFGPVMLARWPHLLVGALGACWLAVATWRTRNTSSATALLGIGLAWFAFAVGGMIAVARLNYFGQHPDQLLAPRYLVWSSLFWTGLAIAAIARTERPHIVVPAVLAIALGLLPSQVWMWHLGASMRNAADRTAVAAAVGVLDPALRMGETRPDELARALPAIRASGAAMFAWPETELLGRAVGDTERGPVPIVSLSTDAVPNLFGEPGRRVRFEARSDATRLLLVDADGIARGIAIRDPDEGGWVGWMRGWMRGAQGAQVRAHSLR